MKNVSVGRLKLTVGMKGVRNSTDENITSFDYAASASGFAFEKGVLTGKIGIDAAKNFSAENSPFPPAPGRVKIEEAFLYRYASDGKNDDRLIIRTSGMGKFYETGLCDGNSEWREIDAIACNSEVSAACYNFKGDDIILLASETQPLYVIRKGSTPQVCGDAPRFCCIETHNERVFGAVNGSEIRLWFSDDFNPGNWKVSSQEAGYIDFVDGLGKILSLKSFGGYLYIFREYGVFRLTAVGEQSDFILKKVFIDTGHINKRSIASVGNRIAFYSTNGLFAFDGYSISRITKELPDIDDKEDMAAAYLNSEYFLACTLKNGERAVIRYNLDTGDLATIEGVDIVCFCTANTSEGQAVFCIDRDGLRLGMMSNSGAVFDENTAKIYKSPVNDLGSPAPKTVRCITMETKYPAQVNVRLDDKTYSYAFDGGGARRTLPVEKSGVKVGFEIVTSQKDALIAPMHAEIDVCRVLPEISANNKYRY